jgi:hypothetical protein
MIKREVVTIKHGQVKKISSLSSHAEVRRMVLVWKNYNYVIIEVISTRYSCA